MSKKAISIDLLTGRKKLDTIIDDTLAIGNEEITYSGKFVDEKILSVNHDSHKVGDKILNDDIVDNNYVISYDLNSDTLVYKNVDNLLGVIDGGYF